MGMTGEKTRRWHDDTRSTCTLARGVCVYHHAYRMRGMCMRRQSSHNRQSTRVSVSTHTSTSPHTCAGPILVRGVIFLSLVLTRRFAMNSGARHMVSGAYFFRVDPPPRVL